MKELLLNVLAFVVTAGIIGILAHILGEKLPRAKFDPEKFPYAPYAWEKYGKVYEKLGIAKWKDKMPDKSKFAFAQNKTVRKALAEMYPARILNCLRGKPAWRRRCIGRCLL